ncbi:MAG: hypothetical protein RMJ43_13745 [Chloroherpetonaceae bacterium]|nr:hypothetical protein [Chthonomonadaceae bacterium]MDW8208892.1 hypothetical protein [Chloroherpetonaceae bacterium]
MKCIHCGGDTPYRARQFSRRCAHCLHPFAFEPRNPDTPGITDGLFQKVLRDLSGNDRLYFTERQLFYEWDRRLVHRAYWRDPWGWVTFLSITGGIAVAVPLFFVGPFGVIPLVLGGGGAAYGVWRNQRARAEQTHAVHLTWDEFQRRYLSVWVSVHGRPERLLVPPDRNAAPVEAGIAPDVTAYSFDRALVVQDADMAAMLVANNFHFENNCAILSIDGYPFGRLDTVRQMLRRNPQLKVFALHDASVPGLRLARQLRGPDWFPDLSVPVYDLGLRPQSAQALRLNVVQQAPCQVPGELREFLTPQEADWLERGYMVELAALRPARLMRAIYRGFAQAGRADTVEEVGGAPDVIFWMDAPYVWVDTTDSRRDADVLVTDSFG